jgi:hypothetical protein
MSDAVVGFRSRSAAWLAARRDTLRGSLISICVHATLLVAFGFILLPAQKVRETLFITTIESVENPKLAQERLDADIMPQELREGSQNVAAQPIDAVKVSENPSPATVDLNLEPLKLKADVEEVLGPNARSDQLAGRSEAARASLVQAFGGTSESEASVSSGLKWLAAHQRADGSWNFDHRTDACGEDCTRPGSLSPCTVAATSMALLCYLGAGHTHKQGDYQEVVQHGLDYLLGKAVKDQYGANLQEIEGNTGMYAQGLATIVLCEAYGVSEDQQLKAPAQFALTFISEAQNPRTGGWRYKFRDETSDTSVAGWQVMAIASGRISGLRVPVRTRQQASRFLDSVQDQNGAFYGYDRPGRAPTTTAVGLLCRMYLGWTHEQPALGEGVAYLASIGPSPHNMYYNYYATQVMHHWGGDEWTKWNTAMRDQLVNTQEHAGHAAGSWSPLNEDGSKRDPHGSDAGGRLYTTCLSILTLEVYYRHLPLYQRQAVEADL